MNVQHSTSRVAAAAGGMLLGILVMIGLSAMADGDPTTDTVPRMLPYTGTLEQNGQPVNAVGENAIHILFSLYDAADAEAPVYNQPLRLEVYAGRFTATIGPVGLGPNNEEVAIADVVAAADDLHLGMTLLGDPEDPEDDLPLTNRQRIMATPYAMWSTSATHLVVNNSLTVAGPADLNGGVHVTGDSVLSGDLDVDGLATIHGVNLGFAPWSDNSVGDGGAAIRNDNGDHQKLMLVGNNSAGGRRQIGLWDDVTIDDDLHVGGTIHANAIRQRSCTWRETGIGTGGDNRMHSVTCNSGEFMIGWRCRASDRLDGNCAVRCCCP